VAAAAALIQGSARMEDTKVRCVEVRLGSGECGPCAVVPLKAFSAADQFDGADPGEKVTLTLVDMTIAEYEALPDFEGW
jgi:hypothetical protein